MSSSQPNTFSAVLLGDLNDFISPGQACVNPIFAEPVKNVDNSAGPLGTKKKATIELSFDDVAMPNVTQTKGLIRLDTTTKAAKVSLSDCLACSGCVTSAETVLLKQQSVNEFLSTMKAIRSRTHASFKVAAVTISPQVRASFAVRFNCSVTEAYLRICDFLRNFLGVEYILDAGALPSDVSQLEVAREFVTRFKRLNGKKLPLLTSSCPGWVCYAEKTHAHAVPHLCEVKSPQQVAGSILKRYLQSSYGLAPYEVYHVSIMQCPDKKLEGARKESWMDATNELSAEVNCVLTATELCDTMLQVFEEQNSFVPDLDVLFREMLLKDGTPLEQLVNVNELERMFGTLTTSEEPQAGSSGGLCAFVFRYAARELFGVHIPATAQLPFKLGRNPDTWSLDLEVDGKVVLRFAASYGFRNIQDVVRRIKNNTINYQFVEVMACPGGCTNGGGLLVSPSSAISLPGSSDKPADTNTAANRKKLSEFVALAMGQVPRHLVEENTRVRQVVENDPLALRTTFNAIKDSIAQQNGLTQGW